MTTTVSGPIAASYDDTFAGLTVTLERLGGVVGFGGGAIAPDQKVYTTASGGVLTMADLKVGNYKLTLFVPVNEGTSLIKAWEAEGSIPSGAASAITVEQFLTKNAEPVTPSILQQTIEARNQALAVATPYTETDAQLLNISIPAGVKRVIRKPTAQSLGQVAPLEEESIWYLWEGAGNPTDLYWTDADGKVFIQRGYKQSEVLSTLQTAIAAIGTTGLRSFADRAAVVSWIAANPAPPLGTVLRWGGIGVRCIGSGTAIADMPGYVPDGDEVYPDHFATNTTPGTTDMLASINAGLAYVSTRGKVLTLLETTYYHSATITYPFVIGVRIVSRSSVRTSGDSYPTRLVCDATSGPQVRRTHSGQDMIGISVRAIGARQSAAYSNLTPGILTEFGQDLFSDVGCEGNVLEDVGVFNQPGYGFAWSGYAFMQEFNRCAARDCKGGPFIIDNGTITGRTNLSRSGAFRIMALRTFNCDAPPKIGNRSTDFGVYRVYMEDADIDPSDTQNATLNPDNLSVDFHMETAEIIKVAVNGRISGTSTLVGMGLSGRGISISAPRFVGCDGLVRLYGTAMTGADDITITAPIVTNDSIASPAISTVGTVGNVTVLAPVTGGAGQLSISNENWFPSEFTRGVLLSNSALSLYAKNFNANIVTANGEVNDALRVIRHNAAAGLSVTRTGVGASSYAVILASGIANANLNGNATGGTQVTVADDASANIVPPRPAGVMIVMMNGDTNPDIARSGMIYFDTGSTTQIIGGNVFSGWGGNLDVSTSEVNGTTGTDGNVRVAARPGVVKIENRSGATANFQVTFL